MRRKHSILMLVICTITFGFLSLLLGQDANWDLRNYHFYNGYAIITGRTFKDYIPAQLQTFFNPVLDIFHYFLISNFPPKLVGFILGGVQGINWYLLFIIAFLVLPLRPILKWIVSFSCAFLGMYGPTAISELGTTMGDLTLSPFVLGGLYLLLKLNFNPPDEPKTLSRWVLFSGFLFGCAAGIKLAFAPYALAGAIAFLIVCGKISSSRNIFVSSKSFCLFMVGIALGFALTGGFWMAFLYVHFKNPFFPFFNQIFRSPYALPISCQDLRWLPKTVGEYLMLPFSFVGLGPHKILELPFKAIRFPLTIALALIYVTMLAWYFIRKRDRTTPAELNFLLAFFITSLVTWAAVFSYYRYLAPLELLAPFLIVLLILHIISTSAFRFFLVTLVFCLMIGTMKAPNWGRLPWCDSNYFGTSVPAIPGLENGMVIMTSYSPTAFVVPSFPRETRFVRVQSNFDGAASERWQQEVKEVLVAHSGPFFLLTTKESFQEAPGILKRYDLAIIKGSCVEIHNYLEPIILCKLKRFGSNERE